MAFTVPAKSQPLHNFSLPHLIWKNHRTGRNKLAGETSSSSPLHRSPSSPWRESPPPSNVSRRPSPLQKQSPIRDSESESEVPIGKPRTIISEKSSKSIEVSNRKQSNKIRIRLPTNGVIESNLSSTPVDNAVPSPLPEDEESLPKIWNLRPRRPPVNHKQLNGSSPDNRNTNTHGSNKPNRESSDVKINDHSNTTPLKKQKFSIALARDEIEKDLLLLTGGKPSRRPKKRPRSVQKQLDTLFPGLWLGSITADSYKVSEPALKA